MRRIAGSVLVLSLFAQVNAAEDPLSAFDQILQSQPNHHGARYYAARSAARMGQLPRALGYLRGFEASSFDDALEIRDFPALQADPEFLRIAKLLSERASPTGEVERLQETLCSDVLPEGTAYDGVRKTLLISSGHRRNIMVLAPDGHCQELIKEGPQGLLAVLGMHIARDPDQLWVANTFAPFMREADPAIAGTAQLSLIDIPSGRVLAHYPLPVKGLANDLTALANGDVLVTESVSGAVYRWQNTTREFLVEWPAGSFEGANGIVSIDDDAKTTNVVVADFHGLWLSQRQADGKLQKFKLKTPDDRYMGGVDGLTRAGDHFVAIQNLAGRGQVWSFKVDIEQKQVVDLQRRLRNHPELWNPTTGAFDGKNFLFVADPELQQNNTARPKPLPAGRTGHRLLSVRVW